MLQKVLTFIFLYAIFELQNAIKEGERMKKRKYKELTKLKGRIREKKKSYREISTQSGISLSAFNSKINGYSAFDIVEAGCVAPLLDITLEEIPYFFA